MTIGEALREAKNYFFCLIELKNARGHKEQAKTRRVAISFRLWGDPEMKLFPGGLKPPKFSPVRARFNKDNGVTIQTPEKFYDRISTHRYNLRHFPGAEMAGVVSRPKAVNSIKRRINAFYIFQLPLYEGVTIKQKKAVIKPPKSIRHAYMSDPYNRWIYILYYPESEKKNHELTLPF